MCVCVCVCVCIEVLIISAFAKIDFCTHTARFVRTGKIVFAGITRSDIVHAHYCRPASKKRKQMTTFESGSD